MKHEIHTHRSYFVWSLSCEFNQENKRKERTKYAPMNQACEGTCNLLLKKVGNLENFEEDAAELKQCIASRLVNRRLQWIG